MRVELKMVFIFFTLFNVSGTLSLNAQSGATQDLYQNYIVKLKNLSQFELSFQEVEKEFNLILDSLILVAETEDFIGIIEDEGGNIKKVYGGLYRLDQDYDKSLFYYRQLLEETSDLQEKEGVIQVLAEVLMENYNYKRPHYIDFLFGDRLLTSHLNDQIDFLIRIREFDLAERLMLLDTGTISFHDDVDDLDWNQSAFIDLLIAKYSNHEITTGLDHVIISEPKELNELEENCYVIVFGHKISMYIPSLQRDEYQSASIERKKEILSWVFENTSFYKLLSENIK